MNEFDADQISQAVTIWTGYQSSVWPFRDPSALASLFTKADIAKLLPILSSLENDFYQSNARIHAKDLAEMAELARKDFKAIHPELPDSIGDAFAWVLHV